MRCSFFVLILIVTKLTAQQQAANNSTSCEFKNLSQHFGYTIAVTWAQNNYGMPFAETMQVQVTDTNGKNQLIEIESEFMAVLFDSFSCTNTRSYFTGTNTTKEIIDNDWGNFIVRDFNFDNLEDFAIKVADNKVGSLYAYYLQKDGKFQRENYLSDNVALMMDSFDTRTQQAYRSASAGCCKIIHYTYQYSVQTYSWSLIKTEEEDLTRE